VEKRISFFIGHEVLFYETTFSTSALEQITLRQRRQIGVMPKRTDREADYMCFSPLRRKTSKLEGEEEYTRRQVSQNLRNKGFNLFAEFRKKTVKKLFIFFTVLKNDEKK
jgi:hypothetical protein